MYKELAIDKEIEVVKTIRELQNMYLPQLIL